VKRIATLAVLMCALAASACSSKQECTVPEGVDPDWIKVIGCADDFSLLWVQNDSSVFARTYTVNWLIDREQDSRVYFIDSEEWTLHYFFASAFLDIPELTPVGNHQEFNILNYRRANRRFVLGKLIHYVDQDLVTLEFSAGDTADAAMIIDAYNKVSNAIYNGDDLVYRPVSAAHEEMLPELEQKIPTIRTEDVFNGQHYQPLHEGVGFGTLRFSTVDQLGVQPPLPTEIVVLDRVPNDISMVSGIVTQEFQTPLAHINLLSKNRGTPNMALRDAYTNEDLRAFDGELVRLEVTPQQFEIEPATAAEAQAYWDSLRPTNPLVPQFDLSVTDVQRIADVGMAATNIIGAKAANMGEMTNITTVAIPLPDQAFAIPFAHYDQHLTAHGIWTQIDTLLAEADTLEPKQLRERLFAIRWAIYRAPMSATFLTTLMSELSTRWTVDRGVRFRSSTNVEDLEEFSGAGLYTSAGASADEGDDAIADAVKVVWASAWNYQAFVERDFYRVDHRRVYMGVLVHPAFKNELANGVALTINEFAANRPAYYINSQVGEVSVTNPTGQATPEQILYYTWYEEPEYEVITRSSLLADESTWPGGKSVFTEAELAELASYFEAIHLHFKQLLSGDGSFAMDIELKMMPDRVLYIKQARPLKQRQL